MLEINLITPFIAFIIAQFCKKCKLWYDIDNEDTKVEATGCGSGSAREHGRMADFEPG